MHNIHMYIHLYLNVCVCVCLHKLKNFWQSFCDYLCMCQVFIYVYMLLDIQNFAYKYEQPQNNTDINCMPSTQRNFIKLYLDLGAVYVYLLWCVIDI